MVKLFYTPPGFRNATGILFAEALKNISPADYSNILYLAPAFEKIADSKKVFHKLVTAETLTASGACYIPPEMMTIKQYAKRMHSSQGSGQLIMRPLIPLVLAGLSRRGIGFSSMLADLAGDLKQHFPDKNADSIRSLILGIFDELDISESVTKAVMGCLDILKEYESFLKKRGLVDEDDVLNFTGSSGTKSGPHTVLIIDGFYCPTSSETNILKGLISHSEDVFISVPYYYQFEWLIKDYLNALKGFSGIEEIFLENDNTSDSFDYCSYHDREEEVEEIARNIKSLYVSGKFRELESITVTFPELDEYAGMIERIFSRYGIPYDSSSKQPAGRMRPFSDLLNLLDSVTEDYPRLKFSQFLSSDYFSKVPEILKKWVPLISIKSGIISGKRAWLDFMAEGSETFDVRKIKEGADMEKALRAVYKKLGPMDDIKEGAPFAVHVTVLQKALAGLGFPGNEESPNRENVIEVLDKIIDMIIFFGELFPSPVTLNEFTGVMRHLLNSTYPKTESQGVKIRSIPDLIGLCPEYLYFGGLTESSMPARQNMDYILPDSVKRKAGLLDTDRHISIQKFVFRSLILSGKNIFLSYPAMEGDDMFLPSPFLFSGRRVERKITGIFSNEEHLVRTGNLPFSDHISEIRLHPSSLPFIKAGSSSTFRVTDIDAYRSCPRRFFIERVLGLRPLRIKEYEIEAVTIGTILHKIMEKIIKEPFDGPDRLKNRAGEIITEILKDRRMDDYWKDLIGDTFVEIVPDIYDLELDIRGEGYISTEVERTITGEPLKGARLKGKIDRFDTTDEGVQIIDYKTGAVGLTCSQVFKGNENLQLFLYAAIMKSQGYDVKRVGIYSLKDVTVKWCPPRKKGRAGTKGPETIDDYIIAALKFLEEAADSIKSGDFRAQPLEEYNCRYCHENPVCPYIQQ